MNYRIQPTQRLPPSGIRSQISDSYILNARERAAAIFPGGDTNDMLLFAYQTAD
jgi:hypothetical protein